MRLPERDFSENCACIKIYCVVRGKSHFHEIVKTQIYVAQNNRQSSEPRTTMP